RAERFAVTGSNRDLVRRFPGHAELAVRRRSDVAVVVIADRRAELEPLQAARCVARPEDRHEQLAVERIDVAAEVADARDATGHAAIGCARVPAGQSGEARGL